MHPVRTHRMKRKTKQPGRPFTPAAQQFENSFNKSVFTVYTVLTNLIKNRYTRKLIGNCYADLSCLLI